MQQHVLIAEMTSLPEERPPKRARITECSPSEVSNSFERQLDHYTQDGGHHNQQISAETVTIIGEQEKKNRIRKIAQWLSPPDPRPNHDTARQRHEPTTGLWLLRHEEYQRWSAGDIQHLWIHGKAGCGKSVLCSTIIEDLREQFSTDRAIGLAYFYFTFSDDRKQSYDNLLPTLICQLVEQSEDAQSKLAEIQQKAVWDKASTREQEEILITMTASFDKVFVVLDALDESPELDNRRRDLLERLANLVARIPKLSLCATSRDLYDIRKSMERSQFTQISAQASIVNHDIQKYVAAQLRIHCDFRPELLAIIEAKVAQNADGMLVCMIAAKTAADLAAGSDGHSSLWMSSKGSSTPAAKK